MGRSNAAHIRQQASATRLLGIYAGSHLRISTCREDKTQCLGCMAPSERIEAVFKYVHHNQRISAGSTVKQITSRSLEVITDDVTKVETKAETKVLADKNVKNIAQTFAPRASGNTGKNPAVKGSVLYDIFTYQAWICMGLGGLLSYNVLFPSDQPDIWRLMGMWSVWMFTIPSLRARDCTPREKDWLNYAFLVVPLVNVTLPLVWKSFAAVYTADCIILAALFYWKVLSTETVDVDVK